MQLQQCRVWLPQHLCNPQSSNLGLVGWVNRSNSCLDLVIAGAWPLEQAVYDPALQTNLESAWHLLPDVFKQGEKPAFLGEIHGSSGVTVSDDGDESGWPEDLDVPGKWTGKARVASPLLPCYLEDVTGLDIKPRSRTQRSLSRKSAVWVEIATVPEDRWNSSIQPLPFLLALHVDHPCTSINAHILTYEQPQFGSHHFSSRTWKYLVSFPSIENVSDPGEILKHRPKKPQWVLLLEEQHGAPDMDRIISQLNCSDFINQAASNCCLSLCRCQKLEETPSSLFLNLWFLSAMILASCATVMLLCAQAGSFLDTWFRAWPCAKSFPTSHTLSNLHLRSKELRAWPVTILWGGMGPHLPDISVAHRLSLVKYATVVALCSDILFGALAGMFLLINRVHVQNYILSMAQFLTNGILRSGSIWLMGVPAGFKLNTELTGVLGTVSLHVTHTWSTLCYFLMPGFDIILQIVAVSGTFLGITIQAAIIVDMLFLFTVHLSMLHRALACVYSIQLRSLSSLLRLFRGRKHNPLRGRLDSYDCTVEEIVVASLMFTPLLLLLPTVSAFYMFFTIIHVCLSMINYSLQLLIEAVHRFPYVEVANWLFRPQRFPSGIWFQNLSGVLQSANSISRNNLGTEDLSVLQISSRLVTKLGGKHATAGDLLWPFLEHLVGGVGLSSVTEYTYKLLSGGSLPSTLSFKRPPHLPQPAVTLGRFWRLCCEAILPATRADQGF